MFSCESVSTALDNLRLQMKKLFAELDPASCPENISVARGLVTFVLFDRRPGGVLLQVWCLCFKNRLKAISGECLVVFVSLAWFWAKYAITFPKLEKINGYGGRVYIFNEKNTGALKPQFLQMRRQFCQKICEHLRNFGPSKNRSLLALLLLWVTATKLQYRV